MEKMVEVERATQDELRQDLKSLFQGAIRITLEMVLEEEFYISPLLDSVTSGTPVFHYFIDPSGGGYIKVLDQRGVRSDSLLRLEGEDVQFYEHVSQFLTTITYWGAASGFDP